MEEWRNEDCKTETEIRTKQLTRALQTKKREDKDVYNNK